MDPDIEPSPLTFIPADLLQQVLNRLSFSELLSLRVVCKKWNAMVCSLYFPPKYHDSKCVPVHFLNDKLTVYNSRTKAWEEHSLAFFQDHIRTARLELVATAGGLICFETDQSNQLVVCNPISKLWKLLQVPVVDQPSDPPCRSAISTSRFNFAAGHYHHTLLFRKRTTIVGLVVDPVTGNNYSIVVASLQNSASSTVVYDSLTSSWKRGGKAPKGGEFLDGDATICNGSLYCLVKTESFNGELFKYDVKSGRWSTLSLDMSVMRCKLIEHCGRVLLVKRNSYYSHESAFTFFQLRDISQHESKSRTPSVPNGTDEDLAMNSLEETDLIENLSLDAVRISKVLEHLTDTGRVCVLGQKNFLYVLKPPYEDGLRKKRTLVTIIDLSTGSCDVLPEMIVSSTACDTDSSTAPEKQRTENVFHLFSASVTVQV